jgi:hypothetical protein
VQTSFIIKTVGAVLSAIMTAIGVGRNALGITNLPMSWWPLATFIIFLALVGWMIYGLYVENSRLLNDRPSISVEPIREAETFYLRVRNDGEKGFLKAQVQIESEDDPRARALKNYTGCWRDANREGAEIMKGHAAYMKIAERISHPNTSSVYLNIWFFDDRLHEANYISSSSHWIGATVTNADGEAKPMTKHEYRLQVTISADPSLREGVYEGRFRLNVDRLEADSGFQSVSHKASLQT